VRDGGVASEWLCYRGWGSMAVFGRESETVSGENRVSYDAASMGRTHRERRGVIALGVLLAGVVLAWGPCAFALDTAMDHH